MRSITGEKKLTRKMTVEKSLNACQGMRESSPIKITCEKCTVNVTRRISN